jgi:demethylmenaquinone methyltransferase/2-methoxy-6-polyprenyl-1,4-benzoquinol methylase
VDVEAVRRKYRRNARFYDLVTPRPTVRLRRAAVERLALRPGARVLDLGCGTGLSLPLLSEAVGHDGAVYGVEVSPDMLARTRERVAALGLQNVRLVEADAEELTPSEPVDGILCFFVHDLMLSPVALPRAVAVLAPGGRVVAAGVKLVRGWRGWLVNPITVAYSLPAITTRDVEGSFRPYAVLERLLDEVDVEESLLGSHYLAWSERRG